MGRAGGHRYMKANSIIYSWYVCYIHTNDHVKSTVVKFTIFLAQGALLATAMNQAIPTRALLQRVLSSHLGAVEARVYATTPNHATHQRVQSPTRPTCCKSIKLAIASNSLSHIFPINHKYSLHVCVCARSIELICCKKSVISYKWIPCQQSLQFGRR